MHTLQEKLSPNVLVDPYDQSAKPVILICPATRCERLIRYRESVFMHVDLEDSVPVPQKQEAAHKAAQLLKSQSRDTIIVRLNSTRADGSNFFQDIEVLTDSVRSRVGLTLFAIPKVESGESIEEMEDHLSAIREDIQLIIAIETAKGVEAVDSILAKSRLKAALIVGWEDLTMDLKMRKPSNIFDNRLLANIATTMLLKAKANGIKFLDGVNDSFEGLEVREQALSMKEIGASGKVAIHPKQIPVIRDAFIPTDEEIREAMLYLEDLPPEFLLDGGVQRGEKGFMKEGVIAQRYARILTEALLFRHRLSQAITESLKKFKGIDKEII